MTNKERLKDIENKWIHSRMDYVDSRWLIDRINTLTQALTEIKIQGRELNARLVAINALEEGES